jgi:putative endonuclease
MGHYAYIIESLSSGQWYYGYSSELEKRLEGHNIGLNKSTKGRGPWKFIFIREFETKKEALSFELHLKKLRNKTYIRAQYSQYFLNAGDSGCTPTVSGPVSAPR